MITLHNCPICNNNISDAKTIYTRQADKIYQCSVCKSLFSNPQYSFEEMDALYKKIFYNEENTFNGTCREDEHSRWKEISPITLKYLLKLYKRQKTKGSSTFPKMLDYGCGPGYFLFESKKYGFESIGIEFSKIAVEYARKQFGIDIIEGAEDELNKLPDNHFDVITCRNVLEHVTQPRPILVEFNRILKPGGILCVCIPNINCYEHKIKKASWYNIQNPTHLIFFNESSLKVLFLETGFYNSHRWLFWGGQTNFNIIKKLIQYIVRYLGLNHSLIIYSEKR